jgi:DNA-binding transcriptional regulator GbsR (MarR family)
VKPDLHAFADRLGRFFEDNGLPRIAGRLLGQLLVCDPPEQTFDQLVDALAAGRSTVSVASRLLIQLGLVERYAVRGERRDRYRLHPGAWTAMLKQDLSAATQLKQLAEQGLDATAGKPAAARGRLKAMREFFVFLEGAYAPILSRWERRSS